MALYALRRRSSKYALQVASFTHDLRVATAEREAGSAVINFNVRPVTSLGRSGIRHQQHRAAYRQKPGNNCPGNESTSCPVSQLSHSCIRHCANSVACAHDDIAIRYQRAGSATLDSWDYKMCSLKLK